MVSVLFDGLAYGMLLFLMAVGLSITMGLMNFVNLAHGAFAMVGGYVTVLAMSKLGLPFLACLPLAFVVSALLGMALELERRAEEFFRERIPGAAPAAAELYRELAAEEVEHIDLLISELTALRENRGGLL